MSITLQSINLKEMFFLWVKGWKNIFNYKGKATRLEFWSFIFYNTLFLIFGFAFFYISDAYACDGRSALIAGDLAMSKCGPTQSPANILLTLNAAVLLLFLPIMLIHSSLCTRRLHELGSKIMKNHYRPIIISTICSFLLITTGEAYSSYFPFIYILTTSIAIAIFVYYNIKIFIKSGFCKNK